MSRLTQATKRIARVFRFVHSSERLLACHALVPRLAPTLEVTSPDFKSGDELPVSVTAGGMGIPPRIDVKNVPAEARSLALICETADAPTVQPFIHWILYRLPGRDVRIDSDVVAMAHVGKNSKLQAGYAPLNPLPGHGVYRYHFEVFALDSSMPGTPEDTALATEAYMPSSGLEAGAGRRELVESMRGRVLAWGELVGTYEG